MSLFKKETTMSENHSPQHFETTALHAGYTPDATNSRAVPLHQTTSYIFNDSQHAANLFGLKEFGNIYTRLMNPTNDVFEQRIAQLEDGVAALALASGHSAVVATILTIAQAGDHIVAATDLYGGTLSLLTHSLKRLGITTTFVSANNISEWEEAIQPNTKLFFTESLPNPRLEVVDLEPIANLGKAHGIPLVVDNTIPTPYLLKPIDFGAAIVVHSATKFIGGQGLSLGGVIVDSGKFDWVASGRFPLLTDPEEAYHGLKFTEAFGNLAFILRARTVTLRDFGFALSPFNGWTFIQGLETLALRIERQSENALKLAKWLEAHAEVEWVKYPGLASSRTAHLNAKYLPKGQGAVLGFAVKQGSKAAQALVENTKLASHLANIGDTKTLIIHPASTTHSQQSDAEQVAAGIAPNFVRISVGIEHIDDIIADLSQAFEKINAGISV
jgi:O-acetylhomoserine (thiol)-lyase